MKNEEMECVGDKETRIKLRRQRVERRSSTRDDGTYNTEKSEKKKNKEISLGRQQTEDSILLLDRKKYNAIQSLTDIRIKAEKNETIRRMQEEERRAKTLKEQEEEAMESAKSNAVIEMHWGELMENTMPYECHNAVLAQRAACDRILQSKNELIKVFQSQLKLKDEEYVRSLKVQAEEIDSLVALMDAQYREMQDLYESQYEEIEEVYLKERDEMIEKNKKEIQVYFEEKRNNEILDIEKSQKENEMYQKELNELREKDNENYNKLKLKLLTDIHILEEELDEMKGIYQLNIEKLEYNYRILNERNLENSEMLNQKKKKLQTLNEVLTNIKEKYKEMEKEKVTTNVEVGKDYERLTKSINMMTENMKIIQNKNNRKYEELEGMYKKEMKELERKIDDGEKIIMEQVYYKKVDPKKDEKHEKKKVMKQKLKKYQTLKEELIKYIKLLQLRETTVESHDQLSKENQELKKKLKEYMNSNASNRLLISPNQILRSQL